MCAGRRARGAQRGGCCVGGWGEGVCAQLSICGIMKVTAVRADVGCHQDALAVMWRTADNFLAHSFLVSITLLALLVHTSRAVILGDPETVHATLTRRLLQAENGTNANSTGSGRRPRIFVYPVSIHPDIPPTLATCKAPTHTPNPARATHCRRTPASQDLQRMGRRPLRSKRRGTSTGAGESLQARPAVTPLGHHAA